MTNENKRTLRKILLEIGVTFAICGALMLGFALAAQMITTAPTYIGESLLPSLGSDWGESGSAALWVEWARWCVPWGFFSAAGGVVAILVWRTTE